MAFLETEAVEFVCGIEHAVFDHPVELEVGFDTGVVEIVALESQLLRVVLPVPGLERKMRPLSGIRLRVDQMLQLGRVTSGGPQRRVANLLQQFFGCRRIVRGLILERICRVG